MRRSSEFGVRRQPDRPFLGWFSEATYTLHKDAAGVEDELKQLADQVEHTLLEVVERPPDRYRYNLRGA